MPEHKCIRCGQDYQITKEDYHYLESGLDNLWICGIDIYRCACGESGAIPQPLKIHRAIAECLLQNETPLAGKEIRFLRKHMAMKAIDFAKLAGVDNATVSRWENGKDKPSAIADRAIRLLCAGRLGYEGTRQLIDDIFPKIDAQKQTIPIYIAADKLGRFSSATECR